MPEDLMNEDVIMPDDDAATADGEGQQATAEQVEDKGNTAQAEQATAENTTQALTETQQQQQEKLFRQADVDRIVKERLARERQKIEAELKNNPVLSYLEQKAKRLGITVEQLIENDKKYEEQQRLNELIQNNIPEEYARKLLEHDKIMQEYLAEKQAREKKENEQRMYLEFLDAYPDVKPEDIPAEVWQEVEKGRSLVDAYTRYENQKLKAEIAKFQQQQQTQQANLNNAASSTGSARDIGSAGKPKDPFEEGFDSEI